MISYTRLFASVCALASAAAALNPLEVSGKDFVDSKTKDRFQIIGVDYQPGGESGFTTKLDPLSDADVCLRDAALMQRLGVNTIRVYNLEPSLNHDKCASIFNAAGIYMILDVSNPLPGGYLDRSAPWTTYSAIYYKQVFGVIEGFKNYDNVLGFFAGNEVINEDATYMAPKYVRAIVRDMKDYIAKNSKRAIPVGYSAADIRNILMDTIHYFECDLKNSTSSRADFFGLNSYSWCGDSSYKTSGFDVLTEDFTNATIPVFFSEYGCNDVKPRIFTEVQALYGVEMTQAFSGGLVYEWTQENNLYGLVKINDSKTVTTLIDYDNFQKQLNKLDIDRIMSSNATQTSVKAETCSTSLIQRKSFYNAWDLPEVPSKVSDYIKNGLPDAPVGKLVSVSATTIPQKVYDYTGKEITNVKFEVKSGANTPSSSSASSTSDSSSSSGTSTATNGASPNGAPSLALGGAGGFFILLASLL
ncbi:CAZyme family GH72 [Penicillium roqueforti]|uniref:1,3-beta-glucanosyltransferase n=1 Tax=Penicillium roqueforti (strain FM164) TaxID=1365484 RepID=W6Q665_PENRF|nr:CAZyme family GH72 [Penicillium roqueforti]CDM31501.1 Glucanosyltransferase [Penicillium roqueforti FM164]KAF9253723.1 CAZyme family GH72 [Penicillium roqueforti]KAI1829931.1 CAZyme family GH72 [Penicillium roqueforti]KAI2686262.1 CAZyme family GH72 [Penicillium roqueforti]KAI2687404.1 CAZyme family GH72 [Penicillium roqueforti]